MKSFVLFLMGICFLVMSIISIVRYNNVIKNGIKTRGVIINKYVSNHPDGDRIYLTVQYTVKDEVLTSEDLCNTGCDEVKIGDSITLRYLPSSPHDIITDRSNTRQLSVFGIALGVLIMLSAAFWYYFGSKGDADY
jgi:hypothetical protein